METDENAGVDNDSGAGVEDTGVEADELEAPQVEKDDTDWKAIAEVEREKAENYKLALTQKRQLRNVAPSPAVEDEDDDAPLTRKGLERILAETVVPLVSASKEDSLLTSKISDPAKRAYVRQLLETRIVRTGTSDADIANDIEAALAIADSKKKDKTISELSRAANNRPPAPSAGSSSEKPLEQKQYKWTGEQARALEKRASQLGVDPEKFKKDAWENQKRTRVLG